MYLDYVDYLELVKLYDMTDNLASSQPHHLAMFFGQAHQGPINRECLCELCLLVEAVSLIRSDQGTG